MSRSVRIGGHHQMAEPEVVETYVNLREPKTRVLIVLLMAAVSTKLGVQCDYARGAKQKQFPVRHRDNLDL